MVFPYAPGQKMLRFPHVYEVCSESLASQTIQWDPIEQLSYQPPTPAPHQWLPCYAPNGYIPALLKPPATGKKLPVVYML